MSTDLVHCPLCPRKAFKNQRGYHKHQKDIHTPKINNKNSNDESVNNCFRCYLCPNKTYKNQQGLSRHESIVHYNYNILPKHITPLPQEALDEFKNILIYTIQKQLKNHIKNVGLQSVKFPCLESLFVGVFGNYLTRYSPSRKWYQCIFKGENAVELVGQILERTNWSVQSYLYGQQTNVILFSSNSAINELKKNKKQKPIELRIEWEQCMIKDATNQISIAGYITMHFFIEQIYFG
ncbi:hypothetical protein C2G38_2028275 [Gigaspora rosea]|uniref:C2H2-type domain-containing protein n=1 Tax=Gigaspora rosea TaxID=44941 RepID=A0A397W8T5_9GLOM|nr:hypothetical protein C2G38_2028275 [Gigaspora rosea]